MQCPWKPEEGGRSCQMCACCLVLASLQCFTFACGISSLTGDGLLLLVDLIRVLTPNYVIQLYSDRDKFTPTLTSEYVELTDGLYTKSKIKRYRGFDIPEFGDNLEFTDEEKECIPLPVFTGHTVMTVQSEFLSSKNEKNR